jgi:hypothetical protein
MAKYYHAGQEIPQLRRFGAQILAVQALRCASTLDSRLRGNDGPAGRLCGSSRNAIMCQSTGEHLSYQKPSVG